MFDELMETLNLPKDELEKFATDVLERFNNPFVDHAVTSIMLNSFPKYETRDLPGLKTYLGRKGKLPKGLVLGLAAIITYYKGGVRTDGAEIVPNDAPEIMNLLKYDFNCQYDEKDSIGKRYRRQDAIGTPFCITVDHQTLKDHAVTIRDRDTMQQERVAIDQLFGILKEKCDMQTLLRKMTE